MPVMKQLNVGGVTYSTVGEASVTQVVSTGTKIATVTIDGTSTDLYAPSGGSSVEPATAAPIVDGTAAVGTSVKYAREDHVHPTDTSRAASTHDHGSITSAGAITSDTAAASGDKLVIADNSDSSKLKRSGIAFGSSTSTFLRNDGTWATPSGGGGGGSWTDVTSAFENAGWAPDYVVFISLSDGKSVMICGTIGLSEYVLDIPSTYAPFSSYDIGSCTYIASCTNMNGQLSCPPYAESSMGDTFTFNTGSGTDGEMFTLIYPLLSAVN